MGGLTRWVWRGVHTLVPAEPQPVVYTGLVVQLPARLPTSPPHPTTTTHIPTPPHLFLPTPSFRLQALAAHTSLLPFLTFFY
jgi:hypothetical protein